MCEQVYQPLVLVAGLEPASLKATDFESAVFSNFTTPAYIGLLYFNQPAATGTDYEVCVNRKEVSIKIDRWRR